MVSGWARRHKCILRRASHNHIDPFIRAARTAPRRAHRAGREPCITVDRRAAAEWYRSFERVHVRLRVHASQSRVGGQRRFFMGKRLALQSAQHGLEPGRPLGVAVGHDVVKAIRMRDESCGHDRAFRLSGNTEA